jgi:ribosomal protein S18 acetylase RimI-like enzyme
MERFRTRGRARGWGEALNAEFDGLMKWLWSRDTLIVLSRPAGGSFEPRDDLVFRACSVADGDRYSTDIGTDTPESFARRLSDKTDCYVVEVDGRFEHASWVSSEPAFIGEIQRWFVPPPRSAYVYESYTRPKMRGRGIYPYALAGISAAVAAKWRVEELWIAVQASNKPSRRAIEKAGFEARFDIAYSCRFGRLTVDLERVTMPQGGEITPRPV